MAGAKDKLPYAVSIAGRDSKVRRYYYPRFARPGPPARRERRPSFKAAIKAAFTAGAGHIAIGEAVIFPPAAAVASDDLNEWNVVLRPRGDHGPH